MQRNTKNDQKKTKGNRKKKKKPGREESLK